MLKKPKELPKKCSCIHKFHNPPLILITPLNPHQTPSIPTKPHKPPPTPSMPHPPPIFSYYPHNSPLIPFFSL